MRKAKAQSVHWLVVATSVAVLTVWANFVWTRLNRDVELARDTRVASTYFKTVGDREFLLASRLPVTDDAEWFDITGMPLERRGFQYGIGKDRIPAIDDPVFVPPDDQRLLKLAHMPVKSADALRVIGYVDGDHARAYPVDLLDRHELVNDTVNGKPITVGW